MTGFAQPIINNIAQLPPDFQDDFNDKSGGWQADHCGQRIKIQDGELVVTDCRAYRAHMDYPDFVIELNGRFLSETKSNQAVWAVAFRRYDVYNYFLAVGLDGLVWFRDQNEKTDSRLEFPGAANSGQKSNRLLVIAKGPQIAFYVNGRPFYNVNNAVRRTGENIQIGSWGNSPTDLNRPAVVAFDNFRIWDISNLYFP